MEQQTQPAPLRQPFELRAYLELFRLPNVFTALADVAMGFLITNDEDPASWAPLGWLAAASALLYTAGMVLNDVFDVDVDRRERPDRPIPSGRVPLATAKQLGWGMLLAGLACAWYASHLTGSKLSGLFGMGLAAAVVLYDAVIKKTPLGPLNMGLCRTLNVLLGMSTLTGEWQPWHFLIAGGVGVYIAGVTLFARTEATESRRPILIAASVVMLAGIAMVAVYPLQLDPRDMWFQLLPENEPYRWWGLMAMICGMVLWRTTWATMSPSPELVQAAVKNCILSLIVIDAAATYAMRGDVRAMTVIVLLLPAMYLGRWLYST